MAVPCQVFAQQKSECVDHHRCWRGEHTPFPIPLYYPRHRRLEYGCLVARHASADEKATSTAPYERSSLFACSKDKVN